MKHFLYETLVLPIFLLSRSKYPWFADLQSYQRGNLLSGKWTSQQKNDILQGMSNIIDGRIPSFCLRFAADQLIDVVFLGKSFWDHSQSLPQWMCPVGWDTYGANYRQQEIVSIQGCLLAPPSTWNAHCVNSSFSPPRITLIQVGKSRCQTSWFNVFLRELVDFPDCEDSRACSIPQEFHILSFILGIQKRGLDREGQVCCIRHEEEIDILEYQVLTREIEPTRKPLEEIIQENVFCLGGNRDHVPTCLCYMLYCVVHSEKFNLVYFMAKRIEWVNKQKRSILPYDMLLTRLFKLIMNENCDLYNESYVLYDRVMNPLAAQLEQKNRKDRGMRRGRRSTSSSFAFDQPSSSHLNDDDDDGNSEGTSCVSTLSPIHYVNLLTNQVP
ncbi:hypothetical protein Tco_1547843 [Tanacetum coccineum]